MKTLEQILEGVTAGGKFEVEILEHDEFILAPVGKMSDMKVKAIAHLCGMTSEEANFRYIARAARNFPALVRALAKLVGNHDEDNPGACGDHCRSSCEWCQSRAALAEALKD